MRQHSIFPISGSTGQFTFYSTKHGNFVRRKSNKIDKKRIATDPRFEAVRNASTEFTTVMNSAKLIRNSFTQLVQNAKTSDTHGRLTRLLFAVIKTDNVHQRGSRKVSDGSIEMLQRFEFNEKVKVENVLRTSYTVNVNRANGDVNVVVHPFMPAKYLYPPSRATHYRFVMGAANLDFENQDEKSGQAFSGHFAINAELANSVHLQVKLPANSRGVAIIVMGMEFYEQTGNTLTQLQQAALRIVHASKP